MSEFLRTPEPEALLSRREVLEGMQPGELREVRSQLLEEYSRIESDIHLINNVLKGYGIDETVYDANDDTLGSPEYPQDNKWMGKN